MITSSEHSEQAGFCQWFRQKFPDVILFSIPNGGKRSIKTAIRLKMEGTVPGVPDLFIPIWRCFLEFKRAKGGVVSKDQEKVIDYLRRAGYMVLICRGAEDGSRQVLDFLKEKNGMTEPKEPEGSYKCKRCGERGPMPYWMKRGDEITWFCSLECMDNFRKNGER